jgi:serine protease Do
MDFSSLGTGWGLLVWLGAGVALAAVMVWTNSAPRAQTRTLPSSTEQLQLSFAPVVRDVAPAVVNVYTKRTVTERSPLYDDPFFRRFFGDGNFGVPRERVQSALGSGVIVGSDGVIVTNHHVIEHGEEFTVALADRREFEAEVILTDERTDLAILRIDPGKEKLPALQFRNSDDLQVGDIVLAIGNPFGVGQTVTNGIISALARTQVGVSDYRFFIQTDAAINPGNSGGALVTLDGQLIGINTAIFTRSGGSIGIGFAIPSNMVSRVVDAAVTGKTVVRPWLGVATQPVTSEIADSIGLTRPTGVLVNEIHARSPAIGKIQVGDVITEVDGFEVADPEGLRYRIATKKIGANVSVALVRQGAQKKVSIKLTRPPEDPPKDIQEIEGRNPLSGAQIANLSPAYAEEIGMDPWATGVVVVSAEPGSQAARLRIRARDIIQEINGEAIGSVSQLVKLMRTNEQYWDFVIKRGERTINVTFRI